MMPVIQYYKIFFGNVANILIDVGTRDGDDAFCISSELSSSIVYGIEARPDAAIEAQNKYPTFRISNIAVSNFLGKTKFCSVLSENKNLAGSSSFYNYKFSNPDYAYKTIEVDTITMDSFIEVNNLKNDIIDFIKVDIEGYTWEFLNGFSKYLNNVKFFHMETEKSPTHENHKNNEKIKIFMESNGFILVGTQFEWDKEIEDQIWVNKTFITNKEELKKGRCQK